MYVVRNVGARVNNLPLNSTFELNDKDAERLAEMGIVELIEKKQPQRRTRAKAKPKTETEETKEK